MEAFTVFVWNTTTLDIFGVSFSCLVSLGAVYHVGFLELSPFVCLGFFGRSPPQTFIGALRLLGVFELSVLRFGVLGFGVWFFLEHFMVWIFWSSPAPGLFWQPFTVWVFWSTLVLFKSAPCQGFFSGLHRLGFWGILYPGSVWELCTLGLLGALHCFVFGALCSFAIFWNAAMPCDPGGALHI